MVYNFAAKQWAESSELKAVMSGWIHTSMSIITWPVAAPRSRRNGQVTTGNCWVHGRANMFTVLIKIVHQTLTAESILTWYSHLLNTFYVCVFLSFWDRASHVVGEHLQRLVRPVLYSTRFWSLCGLLYKILIPFLSCHDICKLQFPRPSFNFPYWPCFFSDTVDKLMYREWKADSEFARSSRGLPFSRMWPLSMSTTRSKSNTVCNLWATAMMVRPRKSSCRNRSIISSSSELTLCTH